jgi:FkbM family methyltransferase
MNQEKMNQSVDCIRVTLNGNLLSILADETLDKFLARLIKRQKIAYVKLNNSQVIDVAKACTLREGDEIVVRPKTSADMSLEKVGFRTSLVYLGKRSYRGMRRVGQRLQGSRTRTVARVGPKSGKSIRFATNSQWLALRSGFATKEPDTIQWLSRLEGDDILLDIGANVGAVSLYAAVDQGCRAIACEPNQKNYNVLIEHLRLNDLGARVCALNVAITEKSRVADLFIKNSQVGASGNSFGEAVDEVGARYQEQHRQASLGISLDDLISMVGDWIPTYLKIDVDGFEDLVLAGAQEALTKRIFKSISVEIDLFRPQAKDLIAELLRGKHYKINSINGEKVNSPDMLPQKMGHCFNYVFDRVE